MYFKTSVNVNIFFLMSTGKHVWHCSDSGRSICQDPQEGTRVTRLSVQGSYVYAIDHLV